MVYPVYSVLHTLSTTMAMKKSKSVINFGPGPAKLPEEVMLKAQNELLDFGKTGISILEMSHRSSDFADLIKQTENLLRDEMRIPNGYEVLFLQGGGSGQFSAIPLNLMKLSNSEKPVADYVITGSWSEKASKEASKYLTASKVFTHGKKFTGIPDKSQWKFSSDAAYVYYCANETVHGVEFHHTPEVKSSIPLVADISSNILSCPFDISKHGLVFAGTQKNLGTSGCTIVVIRNDLIGHSHSFTPSVIDYGEQFKNGSVYNTPPMYSIYIAKLVLEWIRDGGGVDALYERNRIKSSLIYNVVDDSQSFYHCAVSLNDRSRMNVPFRVGGHEGDAELEKKFLQGANRLGMISLKGHRSVGGIRASLYNAVTVEETNKLADYMNEFMVRHKQEE